MKNSILDDYLLSIAKGDLNALGELYKILDSHIYFFALSLVHNEEDAKDILQDVFLKIRANAGVYKPGSSPKSWIFKIVRNQAIDTLRTRHCTVDIFDCDMKPSTECTEEKAIGNNLIFTLLSILKADEREIVSMHIYGRLSHLEISKIMMMPYEKVRWKYSYALKKLKQYLKSRKDEYYEK